MAERERSFDLRVADASIVIGVKIAAANPGDADADQNLSAPRHARTRNSLHAQILCAMQARGEHGGGTGLAASVQLVRNRRTPTYPPRPAAQSRNLGAVCV